MVRGGEEGRGGEGAVHRYFTEEEAPFFDKGNS